jgi:hypothetical protein
MGINPNTAFYEYYVAFISTDSSENEEVDLFIVRYYCVSYISYKY